MRGKAAKCQNRRPVKTPKRQNQLDLIIAGTLAETMKTTNRRKGKTAKRRKSKTAKAAKPAKRQRRIRNSIFVYNFPPSHPPSAKPLISSSGSGIPDFLDFAWSQNLTILKRKSFWKSLISSSGSGIPDFLDFGGCQNLIVLKRKSF